MLPLIDRLKAVKPDTILAMIEQKFYENDNYRNKSEWTSDGNCYEWYYATGKLFQPKHILEIGVRFGYSVYAIALGAGKVKVIDGWDTEEYVKGSNEIAQNAIAERLPNTKVVVRNINSQGVESLGRSYDLISIDGDHSVQGTLHDLRLSLGKCKVVITDDYDFLGSVKEAVDKFLEENIDAIAEWCYIPSYRGTIVIVYK